MQGGGPPRDEIIFSHNTHLQAQLKCSACHQSTYHASKPAADFRPAMSKCLECHQRWQTENQCGKCHTDVRHATPWLSRT